MGRGKINREKFQSKLNSKASTEWKNILPDFIDICLTETAKNIREKENLMKNKTNIPSTTSDHNISCNPISRFLLNCVYGMAFQYCPESKFQRSSNYAFVI